MKKLLLLFFVFTIACGYKTVENSPCKVYVYGIDNRTTLAGFDIFLNDSLDKYIFSYLGGKAKTKEEACYTVLLTITTNRAKVTQSGADNRATVESRIITLKADITKNGKTKSYTENFTVLNKYPVSSELFIDDTKDMLKNVSDKIGYKVISWITASRQ
jgi:hypothetical protein